jgi:hypothetical protein
LIGCVVDNDVLYKGASYQLLAELLCAVAGDDSCGVLGQSRYVVSKKLRKRPPSRGIEATITYLEREFEKLELIEPSPEEIAAAADLEFAAQQLAVALDSGESLLAVVSASRKILRLLTGDKRAIEALQRLLQQGVATTDQLIGRLVCLEQAIVWMLDRGLTSVAACRQAVCTERNVDIALAVCFSCSSPEISDERCHEGLRAYIQSLRTDALDMLAAG